MTNRAAPDEAVNLRGNLPGKRLTFLLTLALSNTGRDSFDLQRCRLLLATIDRYFDKDSLEQLIIVAPAWDIPAIRQAVLASMKSLRIEIVNQDDICPEFSDDPDTINTWPRPNIGWYRQQLIKLAIHEHVTTPFYMTLDSDVLFIRNFDFATLFPGDKAALNVQTAHDFRHLYRAEKARHEVAVRQGRDRDAGQVLGLQRDQRYSGRWYGETPVLLSRHVAADLATHISDRWQMPWRRALLEKLPWTEYSLYFLFAENRRLLDAYYSPGNADTVLRLSQSLWRPAADYVMYRSLSEWNVDEIFEVERDGVAVVVQSYLGYPVDEIENKIGRFIH